MLLNGFNVVEVTELPKDSNVSAVIGLVFDKEGQLLAVKNLRGWDFPGGHTERDEIPESTLRREVLEEACVTIQNPRLFMSANADKTMLFYIAEVAKVLNFNPKHETTERIFISPSQFMSKYGGGMPEMASHIVTAVQGQMQ